MKLTEQHSDLTWRWEWHVSDTVELALRYVPGRGEWHQLTRVEPGGWSEHQVIDDLPDVDTEDEARQVAEQFAEGL